ncbi:MAG: hypothetical protein M1815_005855 [Lichina confinis]|nr:MAG: hypothetical protein M1815_005855 [Lichina confinis]
MDHEHVIHRIWGKKCLQAVAQDGQDGQDGQDPELSTSVAHLHQGNFEAVLSSSFARVLLGFEENERTRSEPALCSQTGFVARVSSRLGVLLRGSEETASERKKELDKFYAISALLVGYAALHAFLQAVVTGPPLSFSPDTLLLPSHLASTTLKSELLNSLAVDGVAPYPLLSHVELICLARVIFNHPALGRDGLEWMRLRTNFVHQRLLTERTPELQELVYRDLQGISTWNWDRPEDHAKFLIERALVQTYYGFGVRAREDLLAAAKVSGLEFVLTGRLGKRTKFQSKDASQLVVLARSAASAEEDSTSVDEAADQGGTTKPRNQDQQAPTNLPLNDDTLLDSVAFSQEAGSDVTASRDDSAIPPALLSVDASNQPQLKPLDSAILLAYASSISNTEPSHGLTREETLPYATRVLDGGSSSWQIYTHALLIRSRIEAHKSRTIERSLLQLQALVDQIIAETEGQTSLACHEQPVRSVNTFLPASSSGEAAPASERLCYIHQLDSPTRWELEAELAARWVSVGGLKTALEIYERLQMFAEMALCYAGLNMERKARVLLRKRLFQVDEADDAAAAAAEAPESWTKEQSPLPADAPRLFCILGDVENDPRHYRRAWEVSNRRYARAQRALGKYLFARHDYEGAAKAYSESLELSRVDHASWFALGSASLRLGKWDDAANAFRRAVQLDDQDADSWSNLAAALLRRGPTDDSGTTGSQVAAADEDEDDEKDVHDPHRLPDPDRHKRDALTAFQRAAKLRRDDWRIWDNVLSVATVLDPPAATDMVVAMRRIIQIRGPSIGEKAVDEQILDRLVRHVLSSDAPTSGDDEAGSGRSDVRRMTLELVQKDTVPLITTSRRLWQIVARVYVWHGRPSSALDASEKAWRALVSPPAWENGTEDSWNDVVDGTLELVDAYEKLASLERTEGLGANQGIPVAKDWKTKARSAIRGIRGRAKDSWEDTEGWQRLQARLNELTSTI